MYIFDFSKTAIELKSIELIIEFSMLLFPLFFILGLISLTAFTSLTLDFQ